MTDANADTRFERLVQKIEPHSRLLRAWELKGGVSARVTALEVEGPGGQTKKMIVRRHGEVDRRNNPNIAADEFRLLKLLQSAGVAAPEPYYVDLSGEIFSTPCIVVEYVEGEPDFSPRDLADYVLQLAEHLARIHAVDGSTLDLSFLPEQEKSVSGKLGRRPAAVDDSLDEGRIRAALEPVWPVPQHNSSVLLHGDYWPGNILWEEGRLRAVVDWEDAAFGDPLADLANSRLEVLWAFGLDAMQRFTHDYRSMTAIDFTNLPYWDLVAGLRPAFKIAGWAAEAAAEKRMRDRHRAFVTQAFEKLGVPR